jgi:hypothetical protein
MKNEDVRTNKINEAIIDTISKLKNKQEYIDYLVKLSLCSPDNLDNLKPEQISRG